MRAVPAARDVQTIVRRRLALLLAMVVVATLSGVVSLVVLGQELRHYRNDVTPTVDVVADAREAYEIAESAGTRALLRADASSRARMYAAWQAYQERLAAAQARARVVLADDAMAQVRSAGDEWYRQTDAALARSAAERLTTADESDLAATDVRAAFDAVQARADELRDDRRAVYDGMAQTALLVTIVAMLTAIGVGIGLGTRTVRLLSRGLRQLDAAVRARQAGDHSVRADTSDGSTEVRSLAGAFNDLMDADDARAAAQERALELRGIIDDVAASLAGIAENSRGWDLACRRVGESLSVEAVTVYGWDGAATTALGRWTSPDVDMTDAVFARASTGEGWPPERPLIAENAGQIGRLLPRPIADAVLDAGVVAGAVYPLTVAGEVVGVLSVGSSSERIWSPGEQEMLDRFALHAARSVATHRYVQSLRALDTDKSDFLATTSHELRTPLTSIAGYLEMLGEGDFGELNAQQANVFAIIERNVARLRALIDDLLILNQLDSGKAATVRESLCLDVTIDQVIDLLQPIADDAGVTLRRDGAAAGLWVRGDRDQIERALVHVVSNAIKFSESGGTVRLAVRRIAGQIQLTCTDDGLGIPANDLSRVFERFFRAGNAQERHVQGTGLGLAAVKAIIEGHGGRVTVTSAEGHGTTVTFVLPEYRRPPGPADTAGDRPGRHLAG